MRVSKAVSFSNIVTAEMDGASSVAVTTTNWPFARICNVFPSVAALRGARTLAGSHGLMFDHTRTLHKLMTHVNTQMVQMQLKTLQKGFTLHLHCQCSLTHSKMFSSLFLKHYVSQKKTFLLMALLFFSLV